MFRTILLFAFTLAGSHSNVASMALEKRRFGQESPAVLQEVRNLGKTCNDNTGVFDQIAGGFISELLAARDPCGRYEPIDRIITLTRQNNCLQPGIDVARKLAALEKNFNPFAGENGKPQFCNNAALPASDEVKCVVPVVDPGFGNAEQFNQAATSRLAQVQANAAGDPGLCAGQSVQQQAIALGISDCANCNIGSNNAANAAGGAGVNAKTAVSQNGGGIQRQNSNTTASTTVVRCGNPGTGSGYNEAQGSASQNKEIKSGTNRTAGNGTTQEAGNNRGTPGNGTTNGGGNRSSENGSSTGNDGSSGVQNANQFTGALLGAPPVVVKDLGASTQRRFQVLKPDGSLDGDFLNKGGALTRACVNQKNACAALVNGNGGTLNGKTVADCDQQQSQCQQANGL